MILCSWMPGFDGVQTLRRIREINNGVFRDLPVIALTANTLSGAREMFRNEGFTEFIPKPIERSVLERVLRRVLPKSCIKYGASPVDEESPIENEEPAVKDHLPEAVETTDADMRVAESDAEVSQPFGCLQQAGINVQMGLDYCCGEEEFYREMLHMFHEQCPEKKKEIHSLYEAANWADYAVKVHALKSTSLTIGAEKLSAHAKALEQAGKEEDVDYIRENHPILLELYDEVSGIIAGL